jgi:hypothetical protein
MFGLKKYTGTIIFTRQELMVLSYSTAASLVCKGAPLSQTFDFKPLLD